MKALAQSTPASHLAASNGWVMSARTAMPNASRRKSVNDKQNMAASIASQIPPPVSHRTQAPMLPSSRCLAFSRRLLHVWLSFAGELRRFLQ